MNLLGLGLIIAFAIVTYILIGLFVFVLTLNYFDDYMLLAVFMWPWALYKSFTRQFKEYMDEERKQK